MEYYEYDSDARTTPIIWRDKDNHCLPHFHNSLELLLVFRGQMRARLDEEEVTVSAGQLLLSSSFTVHAMSTPESSEELFVIIPLGCIPPLQKQLSGKVFRQGVYSGEAVKDCQALMELMLRYENEPVILSGLSVALVSLLIQNVGLKDAPAPEKTGLIRDVLLYVQQNYTQPISVPDIAQRFGYSPGRFSHIFNERLGFSLLEYVNGLRCHYAALMLREGQQPVLDVSMLVGFECPRTFYRAFKRNYGMTPSQYQRRERVY